MNLCDINPRQSLPLTNLGTDISPSFPNFDCCFTVFAEELCAIMHDREVVIFVVHRIHHFSGHLIWKKRNFKPFHDDAEILPFIVTFSPEVVQSSRRTRHLDKYIKKLLRVLTLA